MATVNPQPQPQQQHPPASSSGSGGEGGGGGAPDQRAPGALALVASTEKWFCLICLVQVEHTLENGNCPRCNMNSLWRDDEDRLITSFGSMRWAAPQNQSQVTPNPHNTRLRQLSNNHNHNNQGGAVVASGRGGNGNAAAPPPYFPSHAARMHHVAITRGSLGIGEDGGSRPIIAEAFLQRMLEQNSEVGNAAARARHHPYGTANQAGAGPQAASSSSSMNLGRERGMAQGRERERGHRTSQFYLPLPAEDTGNSTERNRDRERGGSALGMIPQRGTSDSGGGTVALNAPSSFPVVEIEITEPKPLTVTQRMMLKSSSLSLKESAFSKLHPISEDKIRRMPTTVLEKGDLEKEKFTLCELCMKPYRIGDAVLELPCFHRFHRKCITRWLRERGTCPTCVEIYVDSDDSESEIDIYPEN